MMNLVIAFLLDVLGIVQRNKKWIYIIFVIFLWLILCGKDITWDRYMYEIYYETIENIAWGEDSLELGFQISMLIAKKLKFSFYIFLAVYSSIAYFLITKTVWKYSKNPALVVSLYFLYPFILDAEQLRSFMGMAIMIYGIPFLAKQTIRGVLEYWILCIIAASFQISCIVFALFGFAIISNKMLYRIVTVGITFFVFFRGYAVAIINSFGIGSEGQIETYILNSSNGKATFSVAYFAIITILSMILINKVTKNEKSIKLNKFYITLYRINVLSILFLPLVSINDNFTRLPRAILILNYIVVSNSIKTKITKYNEIVILTIALGIVGVRFVSYLKGIGWDVYIVPFFFDGFKFINF